MPRPPKKDKVPVPVPVSAAIVQPAVAPRVPVIDVDNFVRVRDSAIGRLNTMQQLIKQLSDDYLRQTNLLLGLSTDVGDPMVDPFASLDATLSALNAVPVLLPLSAPVEEKKERKKRTHDPNAPKRPLTPYFLYMQTARPIIAADLGNDAPKGAVQEEGQRRWGAMGAQEKAGWNNAYQYNLRLYNARVHSYKHGNPEAKNMTDDEALSYANQNSIPMPQEDHGNDQAAIAEQLQGTSADAHGEVDDAPPSRPGAKKADGRKRKTGDMAKDEPSRAAPATPASPDKKRRRTSTKATEEKEEPKKSGRKKAAKSG